jgi:3-oxoacyl-[acyl-carrier protein] reductase
LSRLAVDMQLTDLKIIVTGAARGLGAHFARRLHEAGAQVAAGDVDESALAELPPAIHRRRLDVTDEHDCAAFVAWAAEQMGGLNALVNNAGILRDGLLVKRDRETGKITKLSTEQWQAVLAVNLTGATLMVRETVAAIAERGNAGVIVNISSIARHGNRGQSNYVAAKAALAANTVTWSKEFAPLAIRVGAVAPGPIDTPLLATMNDRARQALIAAVPVGRVGVPEDIWLGVKFVLECDFFNGRTIDIDGGLSV